MEKSAANSAKMRELFDAAVPDGEKYRLIFGYTEDVSRFNYGFVHGSKTKIGNLIVGWDEQGETIAVVPTVPDLSARGEATVYRRADILKAYRNKYPTDAFVIYPDNSGYIAINAYDCWTTRSSTSTSRRRMSSRHSRTFSRSDLRRNKPWSFCICCSPCWPSSYLETCGSSWSSGCWGE